ncbi:glycine oxidase ThiO [Flexivirga sp. B27]
MHGSAPSVAVVGAGVIGLSTARELHRRGWRVQVYDEKPASGASHAAAGMLAPAAETVWDQHALYPMLSESASLYPEFAATLEQESGRRVGYLETGTVVVGAEAGDRAELDELAALQQQLGHPAERLTPSAARHLEPALAPQLAGAVHLPQDHQVNPRRLTAALLQVLEDARILVRENVTGLQTVGGRTTGVRLAGGEVRPADQVVLCTGTASVPGSPPSQVRPVYGDILRLRLPAGRPRLIERIIRGLVRGRSVYIVPREDEELVVGATSREDGDPQPSTEGVLRLLTDARRLLPGIVDTQLVEVTARARPGSPDDLPVIQRHDPGLVSANGFFRHGVLLTPWGARETANLVENTSDQEGN